MKGKNGVKLADFIREIINTKISKKPVKSRVFRQSSSSIYVKIIAFKSKIKVNLGATVFAA